MNEFDKEKVLSEIEGRIKANIEKTEHNLGRVLTDGEAMAYKAGYMRGHAEGQEFVWKRLEYKTGM